MMMHELEPDEVGSTLDDAPVEVEEGDRPRGELIDGVWVPKHPAEPPPDDDRPGCELIDGVWVEKGMSNFAAVVEGNLTFAIKGHVRANRSGFVLSESGRYQLFADKPKQIRRPDVSFIRFGRLPNDKLPDKQLQLAPDLAVEVVSPTDNAEEVEAKLDEYLRSGTRLVWIVYVPTRNVWAYRMDGTARRYQVSDVLSGEDVLPGFTMPVTELFEGV